MKLTYNKKQYEIDFDNLKIKEITKMTETIFIKELNIEVTKPIEWTKPISEIKIPKGFKIIEIWMLWYILDGSKYMDSFLGDFKGKFNLFYCAPTNYMKINKISGLSGLGLYGLLGLYADWDDDGLSFSNGGGRVVFVREKLK